MKFVPLPLKDAFLVEPVNISDERGFFARTFCREEFAVQGLQATFVQSSISFNVRKGTLRGMHYQKKPREENKLVRCTMGAIFDVIIDLRSDSPTFMRWVSVELSAENRKTLYIPEGFAHGFVTLADSSEVFYQMSEFFHPEYAAGVRWNDPSFAINWPVPVNVISEKDRNYPDFRP